MSNRGKKLNFEANRRTEYINEMLGQKMCVKLKFV